MSTTTLERTRAKRQPQSRPSDELYTPRQVLDLLPPIDLDPCANPGRTVPARVHYVGAEGQNGLELPWFGVVFLNPPYSAGNQRAWARRALDAVQSGECDAVIGLFQARPGAAYWRELIWPHAYVGFWPGRISFDGPGGPTGAAGRFDSALVLWECSAWDGVDAFIDRAECAGVVWVINR